MVIVSAKRTAIGCFNGTLSNMSAPVLGSSAVRAAIDEAGIQPTDVDELFFGNVIAAGLGQAPDRQVALGAGCSTDLPCTMINKVCASGMKSVMVGAQQIRAGDRGIVVAGGMESMSKAPHYQYLRRPHVYGHAQIVDSLQFDGLTDPYNNILMGACVEKTNSEMGISREAQDEYAIMSYNRAREAQEKGFFKEEIVAMTEKDRRGNEKTIDQDEECQKFLP